MRTARLRRREIWSGMGPERRLSERSRVWRLVQLEMREGRLPEREREGRDSLKILPLLQVAPAMSEVNPLQGFAKLGFVQFRSFEFGSDSEEWRLDKQDSSDGSAID